MSNSFAVIILDNYGRVIDYGIPMDIPLSVLKEATALSFDVYRVVETIVKELGYSMPRYITLKLDNYEVTVFNRYNKLLVTLIYTGSSTIPVAVEKSEVIAEH